MVRSGWLYHALTLQGLPAQFTIAAVTDPHPERRREAAEKFGCRTHADLNALLADPAVELVVLATPSHLHCSQTLQALAAGKHVVCEKPMAATTAEADRMIQAAQRYCHSGRDAQCSTVRGIVGVTLPGGFAEYFVAPAVNLLVLPDSVPFDARGLVSCAVTNQRRASVHEKRPAPRTNHHQGQRTTSRMTPCIKNDQCVVGSHLSTLAAKAPERQQALYESAMRR